MNLVKHLLNRKGDKMITASPNNSVREALTIMAENDVGSVVVMDGDQFKGILTERDYSRKIILKNRNSRDTTVGEIMSKDLPKVSPTDTIEHCMELLNDNHIRYLPVFDGDRLAGIVSISDLIKETLITQQRTIDQLENYIRG
ncbi:MAG: CBS domain-containing protein [Chitinophagaceae bacterium]|nr:CBS domain-containing protein [Chitinophagaceae bacterium]MCW5914554.1 CBS domain-containing protein [Chitinophagaceae bacterium]MCZ2395341.1 CBS domain-containing protein [Chitinophagales bacterium]